MKKSEHPLGDAPIQAKYRARMEAVMAALDDTFNGPVLPDHRETGIVLLVFPFGETEGRCNFMSNGADRKDIVALFKEMIARFEGQPAVKGRA